MAEHPNNIILIGYRATGKSSVGRLLAEEASLSFVDLDEEIVKEAGMTIEQMVKERGWPFFRALEKETLLAFSQRQGQVIATGGGAVLHQEIWPRVRQNGLVVWLRASPRLICERLAADDKSDSQRPSLSGQDVISEVEEVLAQRLPLYAGSCDVEVDASRPLAEICAEIWRLWRQWARGVDGVDLVD